MALRVLGFLRRRPILVLVCTALLLLLISMVLIGTISPSGGGIGRYGKGSGVLTSSSPPPPLTPNNNNGVNIPLTPLQRLSMEALSNTHTPPSSSSSSSSSHRRWQSCSCYDGCPSTVAPSIEIGESTSIPYEGPSQESELRHAGIPTPMTGTTKMTSPWSNVVLAPTPGDKDQTQLRLSIMKSKYDSSTATVSILFMIYKLPSHQHYDPKDLNIHWLATPEEIDRLMDGLTCHDSITRQTRIPRITVARFIALIDCPIPEIDYNHIDTSSKLHVTLQHPRFQLDETNTQSVVITLHLCSYVPLPRVRTSWCSQTLRGLPYDNLRHFINWHAMHGIHRFYILDREGTYESILREYNTLGIEGTNGERTSPILIHIPFPRPHPTDIFPPIFEQVIAATYCRWLNIDSTDWLGTNDPDEYLIVTPPGSSTTSTPVSKKMPPPPPPKDLPSKSGWLGVRPSSCLRMIEQPKGRNMSHVVMNVPGNTYEDELTMTMILRFQHTYQQQTSSSSSSPSPLCESSISDWFEKVDPLWLSESGVQKSHPLFKWLHPWFIRIDTAWMLRPLDTEDDGEAHQPGLPPIKSYTQRFDLSMHERSWYRTAFFPKHFYRPSVSLQAWHHGLLYVGADTEEFIRPANLIRFAHMVHLRGFRLKKMRDLGLKIFPAQVTDPWLEITQEQLGRWMKIGVNKQGTTQNEQQLTAGIVVDRSKQLTTIVDDKWFSQWKLKPEPPTPYTPRQWKYQSELRTSLSKHDAFLAASDAAAAAVIASKTTKGKVLNSTNNKPLPPPPSPPPTTCLCISGIETCGQGKLGRPCENFIDPTFEWVGPNLKGQFPGYIFPLTKQQLLQQQSSSSSSPTLLKKVSSDTQQLYQVIAIFHEKLFPYPSAQHGILQSSRSIMLVDSSPLVGPGSGSTSAWSKFVTSYKPPPLKTFVQKPTIVLEHVVPIIGPTSSPTSLTEFDWFMRILPQQLLLIQQLSSDVIVLASTGLALKVFSYYLQSTTAGIPIASDRTPIYEIGWSTFTPRHVSRVQEWKMKERYEAKVAYHLLPVKTPTTTTTTTTTSSTSTSTSSSGEGGITTPLAPGMWSASDALYLHRTLSMDIGQQWRNYIVVMPSSQSRSSLNNPSKNSIGTRLEPSAMSTLITKLKHLLPSQHRIKILDERHDFEERWTHLQRAWFVIRLEDSRPGGGAHELLACAKGTHLLEILQTNQKKDEHTKARKIAKQLHLHYSSTEMRITTTTPAAATKPTAATKKDDPKAKKTTTTTTPPPPQATPAGSPQLYHLDLVELDYLFQKITAKN